MIAPDNGFGAALWQFFHLVEKKKLASEKVIFVWYLLKLFEIGKSMTKNLKIFLRFSIKFYSHAPEIAPTIFQSAAPKATNESGTQY